jgi:hypothetical protein
MNTKRFLLYAGLGALMGILLAKLVLGQQLSIYTATSTLEHSPRDIILASGNAGHWATIARFNKSDPDAKGYDPSYTVIFCRYKPMIRKGVGDQWQITFTSPIAENIP